MSRSNFWPGLVVLATLFGPSCPLFRVVPLSPVAAAETATVADREAFRQAMKRAAEFFTSQCASHGGYVYYYSEDLQQRWGEGRATRDMIVVQPPGTPTVGLALLAAYRATGDRFYLDRATQAAGALVDGQLASGGWTQVVHFGPADRLGKYRKRPGGDWNASSLDDGQTQSALQFLMQADQALQLKDPVIHEAVTFGLNSLLGAQFANGAFPQVWTGPVKRQPPARANYPAEDWRQRRPKNYWDHYTLNDNLAGTVAETLLMAHQIYGQASYREAALRLGDFLIAAQMPEPQPAWCQQYGFDMAPIWARKFEPPAVTGWESQDVLETLLRLHAVTGEPRFLEPFPAALRYLKASELPGGRVARYYELRTNKPLYMNRDYQLTYDDRDLPPHYGWTQPSRLAEIEARYQRVMSGEADKSAPPVADLETARRVLADLDDQGRWVSHFANERLVGQPKFPDGFRYLSSDVFSRNLQALSRFAQE